MLAVEVKKDNEVKVNAPVWSLVIAEYLKNIDVKPRTLETYRKALKQFEQWITLYTGNIRPPQKADIIAYKNHLIQNYTDNTVTSYIVAIKGLFKWLASEGIYKNITDNIVSKNKGQKREFKRKCLSKEQLKAILDNLQGDSLEAKRDYALVNLLARTGLRTIEIERANIEDMQQDLGQTYLYVQGKGQNSKNAFVKLNETALKPLKEYLQLRGEKNPIAPLFASISDRNNGGRLTTRSISRIVKNAMVKVGIDERELTAHSLRHTAITFSLLGGTQIEEVKEFARHADINTTLIYAHNIDRRKGQAENSIDSYLGF